MNKDILFDRFVLAQIKACRLNHRSLDACNQYKTLFPEFYSEGRYINSGAMFSSFCASMLGHFIHLLQTMGSLISLQDGKPFYPKHDYLFSRMRPRPEGAELWANEGVT